MSMNQPYQAYQNQSVATASPGDLTLMLYDGCLKFIRLAKAGIADGSVEAKNKNLVKAQNIIREFMVTLDKDAEVADGMMQMYDYIHRRLIEANVNNDLEILEEVEGYVAEFRDTWKEVIRMNRKQKFGEGSRA